MNKLTTDKRAAILSALVEGSSVNSTTRMCGVSKLTVLRLLVDAGEYCAAFHDRMVHGLQSTRIEADELWSYCGCKERAKKLGSKGHGDAWVWVCMDSDSKLVISYRVGERDAEQAWGLMRDAAQRIEGVPQVTTDAFKAYGWPVHLAFDGKADYATVTKNYASPALDNGRYSPPICTSCTKHRVSGAPNMELATTSYVERQNLSVRMGSRRFTRLTNGFSKRIENHVAAVHLHYWWFNWGRKHATLKTTPAVAAGIADRPMTMLELISGMELAELENGGRLTCYQAAVSK